MSVGITIVIEGLDELMATTENSIAKANKAMAIALYEEATAAFNESQRVVPFEFGTLQSSGQVSTPVMSPEGSEVLISYGGAAKEYALIVHENLDARHKFPTRAKYLEEPVLAQSVGMNERMGVRVREILGGWG